MAQNGGNHSGQSTIIRYSGRDDEKYPGWKFWARAYLRKRKKFDYEGNWENEEDLVADLVTLIEPDSPAFEAIKHLKEEVLYVTGGLALLWETLDTRFPEKAKLDLKGEAMDNIFRLAPTKDETAASYVGRGRNIFTQAASRAVILDDELKGYILLRSTRLEIEKQGLVMSLAQCSWKLDDICRALRTAFPNKLPSPTNRPIWYTEADEIHHQEPTHSAGSTGLGASNEVHHSNTNRDAGGEADDDGEIFALLQDTNLEHAVSLLYAVEDAPEGQEFEESEIMEKTGWMNRLRERFSPTFDEQHSGPDPRAFAGLAQENGFSGILDTGCTHTCAGIEWIQRYIAFLRTIHGEHVKVEAKSLNIGYTFGNGTTETSRATYVLPACFRCGLPVGALEVAALKGGSPPLISRLSQKKLKLVLDIDEQKAYSKILKAELPLLVSKVGHF